MVSNLKNNSVLPMGAAVTRRALIGNADGTVDHVRTFYHQGEFKQVVVNYDPRRRGVLVPDYKIPDWIKQRITTGPGSVVSPGTKPMIPIENPLNQTPATAPVGTQGVLTIPVTRRPVALFGRPTTTGPGSINVRPTRFFQGG